MARKRRERAKPGPDAAGVDRLPGAALISGPPPDPEGEEPPAAQPPPEGPLGPDPNRRAPHWPAHIDRAVRPPRNKREG